MRSRAAVTCPSAFRPRSRSVSFASSRARSSSRRSSSSNAAVAISPSSRRAGNAGQRGEAALARQGRARQACPLQQVERDRRLVREQAEQVDLREPQLRLGGPVEHREHAERTLLDEQRHGHHALRHIAGRLGGRARPARVRAQVVDDEGLARREHPAGDAGARREPHPDQLALSLTGHGLEHELVRLLVEEEDGRSLGAEDRARHLHGRLQERAVRLVGAEHAGGDSRFEIAHVAAVPFAFEAVWWRTLLSWNGVRSEMLAEDERADAGDVGRGEAVAGAAERAAVEPRDVEVEAAPEELDRRRGVVVEGQRVGLLVAPDGDDAREAPREALHGHVVSRGDEEDALEVGAVGELVEPLHVLRPRRREAHVHDLELLLDRPRQAAQHGLAAALVAGAEDADARQLDVGGERAHDPGAGRSVPAEVALAVVDDLQLAVLVAKDCDRAVDAADERMVELDAAVEDADPDAGAGRAAPRPLSCHLLGQRHRHADPVHRLRRQAPGRKVLLFGVLVQLDRRAHRTPIIAGSALESQVER